MREARLVGLSQDGKQLILAMAETGEEFAIPVDDRLRAALRGDRARLGQLEIQMESALRPRDIQARIRAGESPEAVAAVAQMPMERLMAFAGPVLAERDHVATLAQRASVRRRGGGDAPTRNLGAWVTDRLRTRGVDPAAAEWDAWRREDGRWAVRVSYHVGEDDEKVAMFAYDAPGRYAVPDDDEARWLVGEQVQVLPPQPSERRLAAVADLDLDLSLAPDHGADSYQAGFEVGVEDTVNLSRARQSVRETRERDTGARREQAYTGRDTERGPRRVHPAQSPDEEPTLIDVPVEPPPALRPAVRAVERPAQPPAEAASLAPPEERAAAPENRFTERRIAPTPTPTTAVPEQRAPRPADPRQAEARQPEVGQSQVGRSDLRQAEPRQAEARRTEPVPSDPRQTELHRPEPTPADPRQAEPRRSAATPSDPRRTDERQADVRPVPTDPRKPAETIAATDTQQAETDQPEPAPAEPPKKKPARRNSKRASVPSWDEIMFGKKAD